jgi:hypothetical protein
MDRGAGQGAGWRSRPATRPPASHLVPGTLPSYRRPARLITTVAATTSATSARLTPSRTRFTG